MADAAAAPGRRPPRSHPAPPARGGVHARAGGYADAAEDLGRGGDWSAAHWDRAALLVHQGIAASDGVRDAGWLARARAEAGAASDYWSDPTVGRLLWSL